MSQAVKSGVEVERQLKERLPQWVAKQLDVPEVAVTSAVRLAGGFSNETWHVQCTHGRDAEPIEFVVRWSPEGALFYPADIAGQFDLLRALEPTPIPAPAPLWAELEGEVLGEPFLTMRLVPGISVPRAFDLNDVDRRAKLTSYVQSLAGIHALDWHGHGIGSVLVAPRPGHCASTALDSVRQQLVDRGVGDDPIVKRTFSWLEDRLPQRSDVTLIHGDCNISNYRFDGTSVVAILDWDLAKLSDPLWDVAAYCMSMTKYLAHESSEVQDAERQRFLEMYQDASGRSVENLEFWEGLSVLRAASSNAHPAMKSVQSPVFWNWLKDRV